MWRGRRWRKLLNLVEHLPTNSAYVEAVATDADAARAAFDAGVEPREHVERWSEWSPERAALARIDDRLQLLTVAVIGTNGGKPGQFRPAERPKTSLDVLRAERRRNEHRALVARVIDPMT